MKAKTRTLAILLLASGPLLSQPYISGEVTDADNGLELAGVNVVIVGTNQGTITDFEGRYKLEVPEDARLKFSFVGYDDYQVALENRTVINVKLSENTQKLKEVVVTALGMPRELMAVGYSVGEVDGNVMTEAREVKFTNQLTGRVAGVNVSKIASGPGGSSRVVIRGNASFRGDNQPLYVIDGMPMDNTNFGQAGMWGGADYGDGTSSINPDDIESINVLKGGAAANLYGSRASNGVIVINTRKGMKRQGVGVEFNSNYMWETFDDQTDFQTEYGQGVKGEKPRDSVQAFTSSWQSWGAKIDDSPSYIFDGSQKPYSNYAADGNNMKEFFRNGSTFTNSLSVMGGGNVQTYRASVAYLMNESIVPNAGYDRFNLGLNTAGTYGKFEMSAQILYSNEQAKNRPRVSDIPLNIFGTIFSMPATVDQKWLRGDPVKPGAIWEEQLNLDPWIDQQKEPFLFGEELYFGNRYVQNPYWSAYQSVRDDEKDRLIGYVTGKFNVLDHLWIQGRIGMDWITSRRTAIVPYGTGFQRKGHVSESEYRIREVNYEWTAGYSNNWGKFGLNSFIGGNAMRWDWEKLELGATDLLVPFMHTIDNGSSQTNTHEIAQKGINSLFGSVELSFNEYLFLTVTGRNDWFSTLNPETNDIFYPSLSLSYMFSEMISMPSWFTYGQLRTSWARVGGDTDPYKNQVPFLLRAEGHIGRPMAGVLQTFVPNTKLRPLVREDWEVGFDLRFLDNRLGLDIAYYQATTKDEIMDAAISLASGFRSTVMNVGEVKNKGLELLFNTTPIQSDLVWDLSFNFSLNNSKVIKLDEAGDIQRIQLENGEARSGTAFIQHIVGQPFGSIVGFRHKRINGEKVYTEKGYPVIRRDTLVLLGNGVHRYIGGINNRLTWKNFNLEFLIDFKLGGDLYSNSNVGATQVGRHKQTLEGRESGLQVSGVDPEGNPLEVVVPPEQIQNYWGKYGGIADYFVYDASFWKLRQLVFGYTFPAGLLDKTPFSYLNLSFVARNLWLISTRFENRDPESTYNNTNAQGLELSGYPSTRTFGFNLRVRF